jgi:hypothetical protein
LVTVILIPTGTIHFIPGVIPIWVIMISGDTILMPGIHPGITDGTIPIRIMILIMPGVVMDTIRMMMTEGIITVPVMVYRAIPEEVM